MTADTLSPTEAAALAEDWQATITAHLDSADRTRTPPTPLMTDCIDAQLRRFRQYALQSGRPLLVDASKAARQRFCRINSGIFGRR